MLVWRFRILLPEYVQQEVRRRVVILHLDIFDNLFQNIVEGTGFIYFSKHLFSSFLVHRFVNNYTNRIRRQVSGIVISKTVY